MLADTGAQGIKRWWAGGGEVDTVRGGGSGSSLDVKRFLALQLLRLALRKSILVKRRKVVVTEKGRQEAVVSQ